MFLPIRKFFFENISFRQTIFKNTFWLFSAEILSRILGLVLIIYIVRILGVAEYGKFAFAFSFVSLISVFACLGIIDISTREFSRSKEKEEKFIGVFTLQVILSLLTLFITVIVSFFITADPIIREMIWILIVFILSSNLFGSLFSFLRARQKMEYEASIKIFQAVLNFIVVFIIIFSIPSAENVSYGYMFSNLAVVAIIFLFFHIFFHPLRLRWEKKSLNILKISWPLSIGFVGFWVYTLISSVMLGYFNLITENGWYNAALKIAIVASIPADLIIRSFYPVLSNFFVHSTEKLQRTWDHITGLMISIAIPMAMGGIAMAPKIINLFYGQNFMPSIFAFKLLIFSVAISFISYPFAVILIVADQQKKNFIFIVSGAALIILLNFIFIPIYGFYSSIASIVIASLIVLISLIIFSKYKTPINPFNSKILWAILISVFSSFIMYFTINYGPIYNLNVVVTCLLGAFIYLFFLVFFYRVIFKRMIIKN